MLQWLLVPQTWTLHHFHDNHENQSTDNLLLIVHLVLNFFHGAVRDYGVLGEVAAGARDDRQVQDGDRQSPERSRRRRRRRISHLQLTLFVPLMLNFFRINLNFYADTSNLSLFDVIVDVVDCYWTSGIAPTFSRSKLTQGLALKQSLRNNTLG